MRIAVVAYRFDRDFTTAATNLVRAADIAPLSQPAAPFPVNIPPDNLQSRAGSASQQVGGEKVDLIDEDLLHYRRVIDEEFRAGLQLILAGLHA